MHSIGECKALSKQVSTLYGYIMHHIPRAPREFILYQNELFMSDHWEKKLAPHSDLLGTISVAFFGAPESKADFFVRWRFSDGSLTTLSLDDLSCECTKPASPAPVVLYAAGDTVLVYVRFKGNRGFSFEPMVIMEAYDGFTACVTARVLIRSGRDFDAVDAEPNELIYTSSFNHFML